MNHKNTGTLDAVTTALYELFTAVNHKFLDNQTPTPQITIQSRGRKNPGVLGWCTVLPVWQSDKDNRWEINIAAEALKAEPWEIAGTLIHEIAHLANLAEGIIDVSGFQYHNQHFVERATALGLQCAPLRGRGMAATSPTVPLMKWLAFWLDKHEGTTFSYSRLEPIPGGPGGKQPTKMKKWSCGCTNVRCAVELMATCQKCGNPFELQS